MIRPIVVGVVDTREGLAAADWAAREALRRGLPLRLVHAWEAGLPEGETGSALPELKAPQHHAHQVLRTALERLSERHPRLRITAEQVRTMPVPALLAESENAELLVIGSQGPTGLAGFVSGSVALATAARIERPLVLVRAGETAEDEHLPDADGKPSQRTPFRDVAVAVDVDGTSHEVLEFAFHAAEMRHAPLRVVHAWHAPLAHGLPDAAGRARTAAEAERDLAVLLEPWREKFPTVAVEDDLREGRPAHVLVDAAQGAGLLVVGHRMRRAAIGAHTGPVAHALIHHVREPVVLVPHD
ncbi:universal stress protein [Streptomyces sp. A012304]|uniref:universal stress protein n=1 Tax=Streptomyces sp. A012304 TaxID=375446 RepID=UPI002232BB47|nr:universal stress protein [Streptomyces sp. A012304]GKQ37908.1 stress-inducible protein [Streptomyces sp. A012304]